MFGDQNTRDTSRTHTVVLAVLAMVIASLGLASITASAATVTVADVAFTGAAGNYIDTPGTAANAVTGDLDIRLNVSLANWKPNPWVSLISKTGTAFPAGHSYELEVTEWGTLRFSWTSDGVTGNAVNSIWTVGATNGASRWIRATLTVNNGAGGNDVRFYTSNDGAFWTQFGDTITSPGVTSIYNSSRPITLASEGNVEEYLAGRVYSAEVRRGIGGPVVASFSAARVSPSAPSPLTDLQGNVWTFHGSTWRLEYPPTTPTSGTASAVRFSGDPDNTLMTPASAANAITGDIDIRAKVSLNNWNTSTALVSKTGVAWPFGHSYGLETNESGQLVLTWTWEGLYDQHPASTVPVPATPGVPIWVRATLDVDNGSGGNDSRFYTSADGVNWVQLGSTITAGWVTKIYDSPQPIVVGSWGGWDEFVNGRVYSAEVRRGLNGPAVASFAASGMNLANPLQTTDPQGNVWTLRGTQWGLDVTAPPPTPSGPLPGSWARFFASDTSFNQPAAVFGDATNPTLTALAARFWTYAGQSFNANGTSSGWTPGATSFNLGDYSVPIWDLTSPGTTTNQYRVFQDQQYQSTAALSPGNQSVKIGDFIPWNPAWKPGTGNDRIMIAINRTTGDTWEYFGTNLSPSTRCNDQGLPPLIPNGPNYLAGFNANNTNHLCFYGVTHYTNLYTAKDGTTVNNRGAGINKAALITRAIEVQYGVDTAASYGTPVPANQPLPGTTGHAMEMTISATQFGAPLCPVNDGSYSDPGAGSTCGTFIKPATRVEFPDNANNRITYRCDPLHNNPYEDAINTPTVANRQKTVPEGLRIRLKITDAEITAWLNQNYPLVNGQPTAIRKTAQVLARTLKDYGAVIAETGCNGIGIETDGRIGPAATTWTNLGLPDIAGNPNPNNGILNNGLFTQARITVVNPPK